MTLRVATSDLGDSVPSGDLVPSVVSSPYVMYHFSPDCHYTDLSEAADEVAVGADLAGQLEGCLAAADVRPGRGQHVTRPGHLPQLWVGGAVNAQ